jgi:hypothetical protein
VKHGDSPAAAAARAAAPASTQVELILLSHASDDDGKCEMNIPVTPSQTPSLSGRTAELESPALRFFRVTSIITESDLFIPTPSRGVKFRSSALTTVTVTVTPA